MGGSFMGAASEEMNLSKTPHIFSSSRAYYFLLGVAWALFSFWHSRGNAGLIATYVIENNACLDLNTRYDDSVGSK
jgi:hypothetical protein